MTKKGRLRLPARLARSLVFAAALLWLSGCSGPGDNAAPATLPPEQQEIGGSRDSGPVWGSGFHWGPGR